MAAIPGSRSPEAKQQIQREMTLSWVHFSLKKLNLHLGTGGIGKTTLARKVYDDEVVRGHFDCRAWINVSQSYNTEKLLWIMSKQLFAAGEFISGDLDTTTEDLISSLRQYLKTRRYVIIIDDVRQIDLWSIMKHALPSNNQGSRIIVTSRNDTIAAFCKESSSDLIQKLQPWSLENSSELFCKRAFQAEFGGHCPQELGQLSLKTVRKCEGLPLVIAAVAVDKLTNSVLVTMFEKFKLLKVLDFTKVHIDYLPKDLGNLFHLTYLSLRNKKVKKLPKSIGIGNLEDLQTLVTVEVNPDRIGILAELEKLKKLRSLAISNLTVEFGNIVRAAIEKMNPLESLVLHSINHDEVLDLQSISTPHQLRHLVVIVDYESCPTGFHDLRTYAYWV
ncbi:NB-ARC domain, LRR domain containing protein [Parasponia andersonii]|uniref:NB-ARC domain, LRR domain containing protein n=1 Tax=Parasponia andersonii TaxID=3476 RepID=A0A2P5C486_PARAD|nr:NB-ARC domain, LRR domain containing protein [Parasponia andersonii]